MRVAVIVVWRPKNYPGWDGRRSPFGRAIPADMRFDHAAVPYVGIHLASLLPRRWDVRLVHEMVRDVDLEMDVDAVFISTMDYCSPRARHLARAFRARGVKVVVGGLFPTLNPAYFADEADAVVVGEAEPVIARLVSDLERGRLEPIYRAETVADLADLPSPRYDLVETDFWVTMGYEATRGCPFQCSFCVLSALRSPYRRRPVANVIRDLRNVPSGWNWVQRKYIGFWDNNLGADRAYFRSLCDALTPLRRFWGTETSIDTVTPESARAMGRAGCRLVYVGLESLSQASLAASNKRHNKVSEYKQKISWLHQNGMVVMSIFLLGLDEDTSDYLRRLPDLVDDVGVDVPVYSLPAPIEGTPLHRDLQQAGRLLPGDILGGMDGAHLVYRPRHVAPEELELALFQCMRRSYRPAAVARRVLRRAGDGLWCALTNAGMNHAYRKHQRAIARTGLARVRARGAWPGVQHSALSAQQPALSAQQSALSAQQSALS
jgi:radical SAM superfamily enzyme YgiQ (UPF0313 family)